MSAVLAWMRTSWRGASVGFSGLTLIGLPLAIVGWHAVWRAVAYHRAPGVTLALVVPLFAGAFGFMAMALLSLMWVAMRGPTIGRLVPGAERVLRRAMATSGLVLWLFAGLPAVAPLLAQAWLGKGLLTPLAALAWGLGLPLAGAAMAAAFVVLPFPLWLLWAPIALAWLLAEFYHPLFLWIHVVPHALSPILLGLGLAALAFAAWVFRRVARALTNVAAPATRRTAGSPWQSRQLQARHSGPLPRDARWLVSPNPPGAPLRGAAVSLLVSMGLIELMSRSIGIPLSPALLILFVLVTVCAPWGLGVRASPRWALLPGGLRRRNMAWQVWARSLRNAAPLTILFTLALALGEVLVWDLPWDTCLGGLLLCAGLVVFNAGLAVGSAPWLGQSQVLMGPWSSGIIMFAGLTYVGLERQLHAIAGGDPLASLPLMGGTALALAALGLAAVAASSRAWARFDWSGMQAKPATPGTSVHERR